MSAQSLTNSHSARRRRNALRAVWLGLSLAWFAACGYGDPCDPGEVHRLSACYPASPDAAPDTAALCKTDGGSSAGGALGATCLSNTDCGCDAPHCGMRPGAQQGVCTRTGCVENSALCPTGWTCFDPRTIDPSLTAPSLCVKS